MVVTQREGDRKMQLAVLDHRHQFRRARFKKPDPHTRVLLFILAHEGREEGSKRVRSSSDSQRRLGRRQARDRWRAPPRSGPAERGYDEETPPPRSSTIAGGPDCRTAGDLALPAGL